MSDLRNALGPAYDQSNTIAIIAQAFEVRDKNLNHIMQNIVEGFKNRDECIVLLRQAVEQLQMQVKELQDNKIDNIILKE